ncbi:hypothetical protein QBC44DRAFT_242536 [Cladorrhinum sp. PSN332]|nr:hypothetical protein QBC44DRAFT_242536 [Cladorrhinum sp. PSN332]
MDPRRAPRRNSEAPESSLQFHSPRGSIPVSSLNRQAAQYHDPTDGAGNRSRYPREYRNNEGREPNVTHPFGRSETRPGERLYEIPVNSRFDETRPAANLRQVRNADPANLAPRDRARVVNAPPNDPGPYRAVAPIRPDGSRRAAAAGMIYHPEDNPTGYARAPLEPMDREGRQYQRRFDDDSASPRRVGTWPPRDETSEDLTRYEQQHQQVRRPRR